MTKEEYARKKAAGLLIKEANSWSKKHVKHVKRTVSKEAFAAYRERWNLGEKEKKRLDSGERDGVKEVEALTSGGVMTPAP
jgi:hypothetical protein